MTEGIPIDATVPERASGGAELAIVTRGWLALALGLGCLTYATLALVLEGTHAFRLQSDPSAVVPVDVSSAVCAVLVAPLFLMAAELGRRSWTEAARFTLAIGAISFVLLLAVPRGPLSGAWYVYPAVTLLAGLALGIGPGLVAVLTGTFGLLFTALRASTAAPAEIVEAVWGHALPAMAAFWITGAVGIWAHRALAKGQLAEQEHQRSLSQANRALAERERLLGHAMRVDTVGDMAGLVAHQLRNAFQFMMGHAALGTRESMAEKDQRFAKIRAEIMSSSALLEQLLQLAHPEEERVQRVDLSRLCREFGDNARRILPSSIELEIDAPAHPLAVTLEPRGLEHVLLNLVINARHAIEGTGQLRLSLTEVERRARIEFADTGRGIAPDDLAHIFEPYFTTKPKGQGTGLGLTAVDRYVRAASGRVEVESEVGRGTTFRLEFPLAEVGRRDAAR